VTHLSHFQFMALYAFLVSLALAFLTKRKLNDRIKYTVWAFLAFLLISIAIGWLLYPFSH
jgi:hypothetical protein